MNTNAIMTTVTRTVSKVGFKFKKHSPEILVAAGVVGAVTSAVMACRATLKVNQVLDEAKENIEKIHEATETGVTQAGEVYTPEDSKKELTIVYAQTGLKFVKLYGPSVILGALSITSILASNNILRKRNVALGAAYATLDRAFKDYRGRVIERFGEEVDRQLKYNIKTEKIEEKVVDEETGKEKKVKKTIEVTDGETMPSPFARFYDDGNKGWKKDPEANLMFLRAEQNFANDRLRTRGYLFLNEVYERLDIPTTKMGQEFGWVYDPKNPDHVGDNYVDFGIYDMYREKARDFVNGRERVILLDFNVDGPIMERFEKFAR